MKILFFTSRFPYPLDKGDKLRAYNQIKHLSADHDIYLICITDQDPQISWLEEIQPIVQSIHVIRITPLERVTSMVRSLTKGWPFQVGWFYNTMIKKVIQNLYNEIQPDHCFCQLLRMAEYVKDLPGPKTLDYMDGFGMSMYRRSKIARFPENLLYLLESKRMIRYEKDMASYFDHLIIISSQDKSFFDLSVASQMIVVGNGISSYFTDYQRVDNNPYYELVFVGNMSYLPNIETSKYIVKEIMPLLAKDIKLLISGTNPDYSVRKLVSGRVTVTGKVEDIRQSYINGKIFIVPMWAGTGQQNKILEALALGIPCITTRAVNNAIGAIPDKEILLAETKEEFVNHINNLLVDEQKYQHIIHHGKQFVKENYCWKQKAKLLSSIFASNQ